jgi:anti-anti-sigma factor
MALLESPPAPVSAEGNVAATVSDVDRGVVWVRGEQDVSTTAALSATIARAMTLDSADFVVDFSGVQFLDASTVGVIIRSREWLRLQSRSLVLRSPSDCTRRILELCGLEDLLDAGSVTLPPSRQPPVRLPHG